MSSGAGARVDLSGVFGTTSPGTVRDGPLGNREDRRESVGMADVRDTLGQLTHHRLGLEVQDEETLPPLDLAWVRPLLLHAGEDATTMVAEVHGESNEPRCLRDVLDQDDGAHANVQRVESLAAHHGLDRGRCHVVALSGPGTGRAT